MDIVNYKINKDNFTDRYYNGEIIFADIDMTIYYNNKDYRIVWFYNDSKSKLLLDKDIEHIAIPILLNPTIRIIDKLHRYVGEIRNLDSIYVNLIKYYDYFDDISNEYIIVKNIKTYIIYKYNMVIAYNKNLLHYDLYLYYKDAKLKNFKLIPLSSKSVLMFKDIYLQLMIRSLNHQ